MTKYRHFVKELLKLTFVLAVMLTGLSFLAPFRPFIGISWASLGLFLVLTLFSGYYNSRSIKKPFFLNIFFVTLSVKFMITLGFMIAYFLLFHPTGWVIVPLMLIFGAYKVFETVMLMRFSKDLPDIPYTDN